jgi:hypothetical protein
MPITKHRCDRSNGALQPIRPAGRIRSSATGVFAPAAIEQI